MNLVLQITNRRLLIIDIVIIYAHMYGLIMEPHALFLAVLMEEQVMQLIVLVLVQVLGT